MPDREDLDDESFRRFEATVRELRSFAVSNFEHFRAYEDANSLRFVRSCSFLLEHIDHGVLPGVEYVLRVARFYDISDQHPANGFRSLVKLVEKCCLRLMTIARFIAANRRSLIFRGDYYSRELESYVQLLGQLRACLYYAEKYISCSSDCELITEAINEEQFQIMEELDNLSLEPFYGTCLGFQLCPSLLQPVTVMHILLASYSESYNKPSPLVKFASTLVSSGKFIASPEIRAKKVIDTTLEGDVTFCKSFWSLAENALVQSLQKVVCPQVMVNRVFKVPTDPVRVPLVERQAEHLVVFPSCCHGDMSPVPVRLLSYVAREGQVPAHRHPPSDHLIFHIHGGGFVAQSSASHSLYLRHWAKELNVPILSVDYSLAPEFPYPRQVEEIFHVYCWVLNNLPSLGTTGKKICFVGDSAGANLVMSTALRAAHKGIRVPDGLVSVYGSFLVRYAPSPSRLMAIMDPILPLGLVIKCLSAYVGVSMENHSASKSGEKIDDSKATPDESEGVQSQGDEAGSTATPLNISEGENIPPENPPRDSFLVPGLCGRVEEGDRADHEEGGGGDPLGKHEIPKSSSEGDVDESVSARSKFFDLQHKITDKKRQSLWRLQVGSPTRSKDGEGRLAQGSRSEPSSIFNIRGWGSGSPSSPLPKGHGSPAHREKFQNGKGRTFDPPEYALYRTSPPPSYRRLRAATERNTDPFLSPVFASSKLLSKLCPTYFVACHFDPLLDESVHLAKRIRSAGGGACLDVVDDLPHGFLNFIHLSRAAGIASDLCVSRMREVFGLNGDGDDVDGDDEDDHKAAEGHDMSEDGLGVGIRTMSIYESCDVSSNDEVATGDTDDKASA